MKHLNELQLKHSKWNKMYLTLTYKIDIVIKLSIRAAKNFS
jgi:hypothetical protein